MFWTRHWEIPPCGSHLVTVEIKFGFAILAYYTWWLIMLLCLTIVLYKLLTNQNFSIGFHIGIQSNHEDRENKVFELVLIHSSGQQPAQAQRHTNNANNTNQADQQVDNI